MSDTITLDQMRSKLLTVDQVRERLATTEPLSQVTFPLSGSRNSIARFSLQPDWAQNIDQVNGTDAIGAEVRVGGVTYQLTKDALLEATSLIGITKQYATRCPANLLEPHINYWFRQGPRAGISAGTQEMKLLAIGDRAYAFSKASIDPFSNLRLLDEVLAGIAERYGEGDVLVDYKFQHNLRHTAMRLIVPNEMRNPRENDPWSAGVQLHNSLAGEKPLSLEGYLFRWWCTNGAISTHAQSGKWNRRTGGQGDEVYEWARHAVDEILSGLDHEFEALDALANTPIEGDVNQALEDVFRTYRVPLAVRENIIQEMVNSDDLTMYGVMQAITQAANHDDLPESARNTLMEIGGDLPRANHERCPACRRLPAA